METSIKRWSITILILNSLLISIPSLQAIPTNSIEQKIESATKSRKELKQAQRKIKRSKRQKRRINKLVGTVLVYALIIATCILFFGLGILIMGIVVYGLGDSILLAAFGCVLLIILSIKGIILLTRALRETKKAKLKRSL